MGASTTYTVLWNKLAPWLAERHLARTAVSGQQTDEEPSPLNAGGTRSSRLPREIPGHTAASTTIAHERSAGWWLTRHRRSLAAAGAAGVGALTLAMKLR